MSAAPDDPTPGEKPNGCVTIVVKNLSYFMTEDDIKKVFSACGAVKAIRAFKDRDGTFKG